MFGFSNDELAVRHRAGAAVAVACTSLCLSASPASAATEVLRYPGDYPGSQPVVSGGRIWTLTVDSPSPTHAVLASQTIAGRDRRTVALALPAPLRASDARHLNGNRLQLAVRDGRAGIVLTWITSDFSQPGGDKAEPPLYVEYDATSGSRLRLVQDPAAIASQSVGELPENPLAIRPAVSIVGRYELRFSGTTSRYGTDANLDAQHDEPIVSHYGWSRANIVDRRTGRLRYSVSSRALARRAVRAHQDGEVDIAGVLPDGSLAIYATRRSISSSADPTTRRGDVRPIRVDRTGSVQIMGSAQHQVRAAAGMYAGGRGFVLLDDLRRCRQYFVTNHSGTKSRRLRTVSRDRDYVPNFWDGSTAVWPAARYVPDTNTGFRIKGRPFVTIDRGLRRLTLADRPPSC